MSGADFWATSVVNFGAFVMSEAVTASLVDRPVVARAVSTSRTRDAVLGTSSARPLTEAVIPTTLLSLLNRNLASFGWRSTCLASVLSDARTAVGSTCGA